MTDANKIVVDGLAVEISGPESGLPVLFGHSLLIDRSMFASQIADLARDFRCINVDFRGHGESACPKRGFAMEDQAEDYKKVLDHLGLERAAIVGLSMGAMAAMHFAIAHPGRVSGLVLMNTSAEPEPPKSRAKDMAMAVTARLFGVRDFILKQVAALMFGERFRAEQPDVVKHWMQRTKALDRKGLYRAVRMVMSRPAVGPRLQGVRVPTLVIAGDQDLATPPELGRRIADTIPGAEHQLLPRTGHLSTIEEPEVTTKLIRVFLEKLSRA
jgi:pimeloyl-ACP methyl ester carboxylesterase